MNELNNKNLLGKADKGDSPTIIEPFNLNSLPEKEKYDEGVVLSLAKLYNYILDHPIPEELNNKLDGKEGKNGDGGEEEAPVNNLTYGILAPNDPNNNEFVNNLEVMADPVYNPDNYIFVKQFNDQMDNIMNKLGKYEEEPSPEEEKLEIRENYLSHLNTLFNKAVPFLDDLHQEIIKSPTGQYPDLKKEKEENLNTVLNGAEEYYKAEEDPDIKADAAKNMCDACLNLIDDLSKDGIIDKDNEIKLLELKKKLDQLWSLVNHAVKSDNNNQLLDHNNTNKTSELLNKLDDAINNKGLNDKKLRQIPYHLSKRLENGEDKIGQDLLDFIIKDLKNHGDEDTDIKEIDMQTLTTLSNFPNLMKQIMKNPSLWDELKKNYLDPNITYQQRLMLAQLFNNAAQSNYNIESMINNDAQGIKALLNKMINNPVESLDDGGREIAETEVDTLCNMLKDRNNYKALSKGDLITDDDVEKLQNLYTNLDPKIGEPLRPILAQIREADKAKKEKDDVAEDEKKLLDLEKKVGNCFENHKRALMNYAAANRNPAGDDRYIPGKLSDDRFGDMGRRDDDDNRRIPGKLKNPFDGQDKGGDDRDRKIPGKLKNPFDGQDKNKFGDNGTDNNFLKNASSLRKMSFVSGVLLLNSAENAKIKSLLSSKENPEITDDLNKILSLLRKNYNDMKTTEDPELNIKRADNIHKCLNLLKKISLAPDNHKPILEGGFMNFMEKLDDDYKLFKEDGEPDLNNKLLGFDVNGKNVLQACSNSDNAIPIISESPVFDSTIKEVNQLYDKPELIAANSDIEKLFSYDNVIFSNLCKNKTAFDTIFNKMGLDRLLKLGKKTGNKDLLNAILNMLKNYVKNTPNKEEIPSEILDDTLEIMNKCAHLADRNAPLMCKVLDLGTILYNDEKLKPRVDNLCLLKSMNDDIEKFNGNHQYLNSCLGCLSKLTKDNPINGQEALDSGVIQKLNVQVSNIVKDGPEKYDENKDNNEDDENGYLKTCFNLSKLYNSLVHNDMENVDKFNRMGITDNTVNMLDHFNNKVKPKSEEEKAVEENREQGEEQPEEIVDNLKPEEMVRGIMQNCAETLEIITVPPASNDYLSSKTTFSDTMNKTLENENNDLQYLKSALHAVSNHLYAQNGKNYSKLDLPNNQNIIQILKFYQILIVFLELWLKI